MKLSQEEYIFEEEEEEEEEGLKNSILFEFLFHTPEEQLDCNTSHIYNLLDNVCSQNGWFHLVNSNYYFV